MYRSMCCDAPAQAGCGCVGILEKVSAEVEQKKQAPVKKINIASGEDAMVLEEEAVDYA